MMGIKRLFDWLGEHGSVPLLAVLLIVGGAWGFIELAEEVHEGGTQQFDEWAIRVLRDPTNPDKPIGPRWFAEAARDVTALGGMIVLAIVTAVVIGYLLIEGKHHAALFVTLATLSGVLVSSVLKHFFARPRPDSVAHLSYVYTSSFPSGHSMLSAVVYLTLGSLLMRFASRRRVKLYYLLVAMMLTGLIGISRIFMGVHYPTDVLAGWTAGLVWALLCWLIARMLQRRGAVERDEPPPAS